MTRASAPDELIRHLRQYTQETEQYIAAMSSRHALHRTDLAALSHVMEGADPTPTGISRALHLSPSATSALLDRLERSGHVERHRSPTDRRSIDVSVTDSAREVGFSMFSGLARHVRAVLEDYSDDELLRTAELLDRLTTATRRATEDALPPG